MVKESDHSINIQYIKPNGSPCPSFNWAHAGGKVFAMNMPSSQQVCVEFDISIGGFHLFSFMGGTAYGIPFDRKKKRQKHQIIVSNCQQIMLAFIYLIAFVKKI